MHCSIAVSRVCGCCQFSHAAAVAQHSDSEFAFVWVCLSAAGASSAAAAGGAPGGLDVPRDMSYSTHRPSGMTGVCWVVLLEGGWA